MYADEALARLGTQASPAVAVALAERLAQSLAPLPSLTVSRGIRQKPGGRNWRPKRKRG
jgi:hypothetical protein